MYYYYKEQFEIREVIDMEAVEQVYLKYLDEHIQVVEDLDVRMTKTENIHTTYKAIVNNDWDTLYNTFHLEGILQNSNPDMEMWKSIQFYWKSIIISANAQADLQRFTVMTIAQVFSLFRTIDHMGPEQFEAGARFLTDKMMNLYATEIQEFETISNPHVAKAVRTIHRKIKSPELKLHTVAEELDISAPYLSTIFQEEMDETITTYIHRKKIKASSEHLIFTDYSVKKVAEEFGYSSVTSYGRKFKEIMGTTPLKYRKTHFI